jgi:hypothetical protein
MKYFLQDLMLRLYLKSSSFKFITDFSVKMRQIIYILGYRISILILLIDKYRDRSAIILISNAHEFCVQTLFIN